MANTQTIKQKFLDILFENEEDDLYEEEKPRVTREAPRVKASDLLYGKKKEEKKLVEVNKEPAKQEVKPEVKQMVENNTFINYGEEDKNAYVSKTKTEKVEEYVYSPALSPIFGNVEKDKKNKKDETISVDYASVDKTSSNHLGIVLSPIYGYDSAKVTEVKEPVKKKEEFKDKDITTDLGDIFATDEFRQEAFDAEEEKQKTSEIDLFSDFYTTKD